jgi:hypothetical protein
MYKFGIDWGESHHNLCIRNDKGAIVSQIEFKHTLEGFERFDYERRKLGVPAIECLVAIETAYNLLVDFLLDRGYTVYLIPPQAPKGYRNRQRSTDAHTDDTDAALLSSILHTDLESHRRLQPNSALTQQILAQVRLIDLLRCSSQRQANQLRAVLFRVYPQALGLFGKLTAHINLHFLMAYPKAQEAQGLTRAAFEAFCREHRYGQLANLGLAHPTTKVQGHRQRFESRPKLPFVATRHWSQDRLAHRRRPVLLFVKADVVGLEDDVLHDNIFIALEFSIRCQLAGSTLSVCSRWISSLSLLACFWRGLDLRRSFSDE